MDAPSQPRVQVRLDLHVDVLLQERSDPLSTVLSEVLSVAPTCADDGTNDAPGRSGATPRASCRGGQGGWTRRTRASRGAGPGRVANHSAHFRRRLPRLHGRWSAAHRRWSETIRGPIGRVPGDPSASGPTTEQTCPGWGSSEATRRPPPVDSKGRRGPSAASPWTSVRGDPVTRLHPAPPGGAGAMEGPE